MTNTITFTVYGTPAPQGSKRHVGGGRLIEMSKKVQPWRHAVALAARQQTPRTPPPTTPVGVQIAFYLPRTKAMRDKPAPPMVQRPDVDKLIRSTLDGLTMGGAVTDDAQITTVTASKQRAGVGEPPRAVITLRYRKSGEF